MAPRQFELQQRENHPNSNIGMKTNGVDSAPSSASSAALCVIATTPKRKNGYVTAKSAPSDLEFGGSSCSNNQESSTPARRTREIRQHGAINTVATIQQRRRRRKHGSGSGAFSNRNTFGAGVTVGRPKFLRLPATTTIPLLVLVDMFAVSLVVPLLFQYYQLAGVTSAKQREFLSSIFSVSQIVGGLLFGVLTDAKLMRRKTILLASFGGSAVSYALIVFGGLSAILFSRVLVGLVKQTMTVATTLLSRLTTRDTRARHMGRLQASSTFAWIAGPSAGALLYKHVDHRAPALLACGLFVLNFVLAAILLDEEPEHDAGEESASQDNGSISLLGESETAGVAEDDGETGGRQQKVNKDQQQSKGTKKRGFAVMLSNIRSCFSSRTLGAVVVTQLVITWVSRSTSYAQLGSFYEDMYGLEPHHRGYISSYQQLLKFFVNLALVGPVLGMLGGERQAIVYGTAVMAVATWFESQQSLPLFLSVLCPLISLSVTITDVSIQSLVTHVAPSESLFSVLAALDVLQNAVSVSVPFYRTVLFRVLAADPDDASTQRRKAQMEGDPDPVAWVRNGAVHYATAALIASYLLISSTSDRMWAESMDPSSPQSKKKKGR